MQCLFTVLNLFNSFESETTERQCIYTCHEYHVNVVNLLCKHDTLNTKTYNELFLCSSFVNLISDDDSDWEKDPAVQTILQQSMDGPLSTW